MTRDEIVAIFQKTGAMLSGHFRLTSGRHSNRYFQCALVLQHPDYSELLCRELAARFAGDGISVVIGPAMGGIIVSYEVARALGVRGLFAERENGVMTLRRGFSIEPGERVLVVEDVITTGGSVREVMEAVRKSGGTVAGAGVLVDRSNGAVDLGVRTEALLTAEVVSYAPEDCPFCKQGIPAVKPGSRKI
ncbi:MAG: orotate phosphoribosyltransferase [Pelotomaculum sp.]|uniref:Orotate phosphoribosyltransferase n=1 Tax=Pelotomaculum thermopropionicum (strain DSM 13744 / JCM 10971 / SI) TaxID=370438 RepID=PYRE_PELTS|nr:RecName: Full=Orotate phosphoribosyltransferase; Short=OPRT; Short=OPRTase [Pelotomaculum thermopropionicum SI]NPV72763.1 orotate phosphoribosyltransferase [Pelotomaculum sp.]BAF59985.1 orotate phosphoribosyltransferase [Pelotomaculum thermopropionicum SI]